MAKGFKLWVLGAALFLFLGGARLGAGNTWARVFGGDDEDIATSVSPTSDGGFIVAGWSRSFALTKSLQGFVI